MCKVVYNSITNVNELGKRLNNYYKLFTFWSEIHALSRFRRVFDFGPLFGPFSVAFCLLFLTNMADYRQVAARRAHAAAHAPEAYARDADAFRRMHACRAAESLRPRVRRRRGCFPKSACMPRSRVPSCNLRFDAGEPRALDGPSLARRRAPLAADTESDLWHYL